MPATVRASACLAGVSALLGPAAVAAAALQTPLDIVAIDTRAPIASFRPHSAFGIAIDGGDRDESAPVFLPANRGIVQSLGAHPVSYRLRTELGIEAWHWSSYGTWSDPAHRQGYWTGDAAAADDGALSYGYRLPRRGDTFDEANNDGYSRIDDGDPASFWKSDPYLDGRYTGLPGERTEWLVVELPKAAPIDAIDIRWAAPFARRFRVQYWIGEDEYTGRWYDFPGGKVADGKGAPTLLRLAPKPVGTKFVRLLLEQSSHTAPPGATDPRDALGYAVAELGLGTIDAGGGFRDLVRHGRGHTLQTIIHVSSTDPWHRAIDRDPDTAQPSLIKLHQDGLIGADPVMIPAGVLYDTPENMLAMIAHLERFGVPIGRVELGEEPDGQFVAAETYGALYTEFADRIRRAYPALKLGGPSLNNGVSDTWLDDSPDQSWTSQFIAYLRRRHALPLLDFFSLEYFPFDDVCGSATAKLEDETLQMRDLYARLKEDRVPASIPWMITEYGFSAFAGTPLVEMPSALLNADVLGDFLGRGGAAAFVYGFAPDHPIAGETRCAGRGNLMLWEADGQGRATWAMPSLYAQRLITEAWTQPGDGLHLLYRATSRRDARGRRAITAYPVRRPDGRWSVMLINRETHAIRAALRFSAVGPRPGSRLRLQQYSSRQYRWDATLGEGRPSLDRPPSEARLKGLDEPVTLPPMSLSVLQEVAL